jgi:uncharacterized lipoprotein NlpE involved in copper resistance
MKKIILSLSVALLLLGCSNEQDSLNTTALSTTSNGDLTAKAAASTSNWGDYNVAVSVSTDGSEWTYTITRAKANAKNLSHFIVDLQNCGNESATFGGIVWATVNGNPVSLAASEGSGTGCNPQASTLNFVKFDNLPSSTTGWILTMKFDRGYETFTTAAGWIKAGTSCNQGIIAAPGCPKTARCSFSQGYFFANGATNNGASAFWTTGLTIGTVTYSQSQGNQAWFIDRGPGGDSTMNAFFQLGAVRLSGVESAVSSDAAIIDAYYNGIDIFSSTILSVGYNGPNAYQYFNLPASSGGFTKAQVTAAGGRIGTYIQNNHCE